LLAENSASRTSTAVLDIGQKWGERGRFVRFSWKRCKLQKKSQNVLAELCQTSLISYTGNADISWRYFVGVALTAREESLCMWFLAYFQELRSFSRKLGPVLFNFSIRFKTQYLLYIFIDMGFAGKGSREAVHFAHEY
jgi:hypothetical protein